MTKEELKAYIAENIYSNNNKLITGNGLQEVLNTIVDNIGGSDEPHIIANFETVIPAEYSQSGSEETHTYEQHGMLDTTIGGTAYNIPSGDYIKVATLHLSNNEEAFWTAHLLGENLPFIFYFGNGSSPSLLNDSQYSNLGITGRVVDLYVKIKLPSELKDEYFYDGWIQAAYGDESNPVLINIPLIIRFFISDAGLAT